MFYLLPDPSAFSEEELKTFCRKLSSQRKKKVDDLRFFQDKIASASAYLLLRLLLREGFGYEKAPLFDFGSEGKPYLSDNKEISISLSHDRSGAAACASKNKIGVDVQTVFRYEDMLAERILSENEKKRFDRIDRSDGLFTRMWTMKESLGKKSGEGVLPFLTTTDFSQVEGDGIYFICGDVFTVGQKNGLFFSVCGKEEEEADVLTPERFFKEVLSLSDAQI